MIAPLTLPRERGPAARLRKLALCLLVMLPGAQLLSGCNLIPIPKTPEQSVLESLQGDPSVRSVQILGSRIWSGGSIVLYNVAREDLAQHSLNQMFGATVGQNPAGGLGFESTREDERGVTMPASAILCYGVDLGSNYSIVYGKARLPDVATVEADFNNGKTASDSTTNGVFAVIEPHGTQPTNIRALDASGTVLYQTTVPAIARGWVPTSRNASMSTAVDCVP